MAASLVVAGCGPVSAAAPAATPASIGVAGAVKGLVKAIPAASPQSVGRMIQSGKPLYLNEHVTTGPGGHLQILLNDETVFTVGPNSDIVLDAFVYDPATDAGKVTASVSKGVFRFITGNIGKKDPSKMEVKLPAGTIGIRGTIVAGQVNKDGTSMAVLLGPGPATNSGARVGAFNLSNSAGSVFIEKPGFGSTLREGTPPTPPALIPAAQMKAILGDLSPKTIAQRADEGKQMMAERLAQRLAGDKEGPDGPEGREEGGRPLNETEKKIAEKMMAGEPLSPEEQAQAREGMKNGNMSEAEMKIAEKMMAGENLTPAEHQKVGMMMAGEQMMEHMGPERMTPEQRAFAEKMMAGTMSPEQQQMMMQKMSPEQRSLMGEMMMPGMEGAYHFESDPNAMMAGDPRMGFVGEFGGEFGGEFIGEFGPYGGIDQFLGTPEFFNAFHDPSTDPNFNGGFKLAPGTAEVPNGPTTWEAIRSQVVSGTGYFPGKTGAFTLQMCNGGACTNAVGTWGFSNINVNFVNKTIGGTANIGAITAVSADGIAVPITDNRAFNVNFTSLAGEAKIVLPNAPVATGGGVANYNFTIGNGGGIPASVLAGNAGYMNPNTPALNDDTQGSGVQLVSDRVNNP